MSLLTNETINHILDRRSIRSYKPEAIPADVVETLLTAAVHAPTARNTQKVVFSFFGDRITAGVPDDAPFDLVDLGICKLHFEIGMRELFPQCRFAWGNGGAFNPAA